MKRIAVYAGSFDPITNGHLDLVKRASVLFDEVVLAVGNNSKKHNALSMETRLGIVETVTQNLPNVTVDGFQGLLFDYCRTVGATVILRGLRAVTDFEFEFQIGLANMDMAPEIETVFLLTEPKNIFISSSLVREIASHDGDISSYVPEEVIAPLQATFTLD